TSETNSFIRQEALRSLAETGQPEARKLLVLVAKEPPTEGPLSDRNDTLDRRLTALRGLGRFNDGQATDALLFVLANDKDVAVRSQAHESLEEATGRSLPPDPRAWDELLHPAQGGPPAAPRNHPFLESLVGK